MPMASKIEQEVQFCLIFHPMHHRSTPCDSHPRNQICFWSPAHEIGNAVSKIQSHDRLISIPPMVDSLTTSVDGANMLFGACSGSVERLSANSPASRPNSTVP
jgi:hypothetical protein